MSTEHFEELNDQQIVRREKMTALAEQGIDPFGKRFERSTNSAELKAQYEDKEKEELVRQVNGKLIIINYIHLEKGILEQYLKRQLIRYGVLPFEPL